MKQSENRLINLIDKGLIGEGSSFTSSGVDRILEGLSNMSSPPSLPVKVTQAEWSVTENPSRLIREFEFNNFSHLKYFLDSLLSYQEDTHHHAAIFIESRVIQVETYTHGIEMVTELDIDLAKFCDEVYDDILHINRISGEEYAFNE